MIATHTRVHTEITFANPYLGCTCCGKRATGYHDPAACGCTAPSCLRPCGHIAEAASICPSWSPVDGCTSEYPCPEVIS